MYNARGGSLWIGDCLELMQNIPDQSVDMVLTDVPYNEVNRKSGGLRKLDKGVADDALFDEHELVRKLDRVCHGSIYLFCGIKQISDFTSHLIELGWSTRLGVWHKTNPSPMNGQRMWLSGVEACVFARKPKAIFNEHCKSAVWSCASQQSKIHPTQKPEKLFQRLIEASTERDGVVFDPFSGSGTTAIAAIQSDRRWLCIERDPEYFFKSMLRIQEHP